MGHAVYSLSDPRADILMGCARDLSVEKGYEREYALYEKVSALPAVKVYEPEADEITEEDLKERDNAVTITKVGDIFCVEGEWLRRIMRRCNFDDYESLQYFQRVLRISGVIEKLVEAGVKENDTVDIYGFEFDFVY